MTDVAFLTIVRSLCFDLDEGGLEQEDFVHALSELCKNYTKPEC